MLFHETENMSFPTRRQGPRYLADRAWSTLENREPMFAQNVARLDFRFYGGWYGPQKLTSYGAIMEAEVQRDFPFMLKNSNRDGNAAISGELAQSLLRLPKHMLPYTFRNRQGSPRITCSHPTQIGCGDPQRPILVVHEFFDTGKRPAPGCPRRVEQVLGRSEQKLVDRQFRSKSSPGPLSH